MEIHTMGDKQFAIEETAQTANAQPQPHRGKGNGSVVQIDLSQLETLFKQYVEQQAAQQGSLSRIWDGVFSLGGAVAFVAGAGVFWLGGKLVSAAFGGDDSAEEE
jgi:hypothetical protein